jgi:hypothetical protein
MFKRWKKNPLSQTALLLVIFVGSKLYGRIPGDGQALRSSLLSSKHLSSASKTSSKGSKPSWRRNSMFTFVIWCIGLYFIFRIAVFIFVVFVEAWLKRNELRANAKYWTRQPNATYWAIRQKATLESNK